MVNWHPLGTIWHPLEGAGNDISTTHFNVWYMEPLMPPWWGTCGKSICCYQLTNLEVAPPTLEAVSVFLELRWANFTYQIGVFISRWALGGRLPWVNDVARLDGFASRSVGWSRKGVYLMLFQHNIELHITRYNLYRAFPRGSFWRWK